MRNTTVLIQTSIKGEINMKHYVYKMTNELNGWIYIGQHYQTDVDALEDGYVGRGRKIIRDT